MLQTVPSVRWAGEDALRSPKGTAGAPRGDSPSVDRAGGSGKLFQSTSMKGSLRSADFEGRETTTTTAAAAAPTRSQQQERKTAGPAATAPATATPDQTPKKGGKFSAGWLGRNSAGAGGRAAQGPVAGPGPKAAGGAKGPPGVRWNGNGAVATDAPSLPPPASLPQTKTSRPPPALTVPPPLSAPLLPAAASPPQTPARPGLFRRLIFALSSRSRLNMASARSIDPAAHESQIARLSLNLPASRSARVHPGQPEADLLPRRPAGVAGGKVPFWKRFGTRSARDMSTPPSTAAVGPGHSNAVLPLPIPSKQGREFGTAAGPMNAPAVVLAT